MRLVKTMRRAKVGASLRARPGRRHFRPRGERRRRRSRAGLSSPAVSPHRLALAAAALASCAPAKQAWSEAAPPRPEVFLDVLPRDAEGRLDGVPVGQGPITLKLGDARARVEVKAAGFAPWELAL